MSRRGVAQIKLSQPSDPIDIPQFNLVTAFLEMIAKEIYWFHWQQATLTMKDVKKRYSLAEDTVGGGTGSKWCFPLRVVGFVMFRARPRVTIIELKNISADHLSRDNPPLSTPT